MISWWPRWASILMVVALAAFAIIAVRSLREPVLRAAGWALVVNEPVASADIIVVSLNSGGAGALEAADLVQRGISKRVAVFMDPPSETNHEFIRRGLPNEDEGARQIRQLRSLGVTDVVRISTIEGTESEVEALLPWCDEHQLRSIVFVAIRHASRFNPRATQILTPTDGGKLAAASGQKSSSSRNSCSRSCCTQCHFSQTEKNSA
jgi:hypothetical protein